MMDWFLPSQGWAEIWSKALWRVSWQGGLALMVVWMLCRFWPGLPARVQCWLWRLAYLKLMLAFFWANPVLLPVLSPDHESKPAPPIRSAAIPSPIRVLEKGPSSNLELSYGYASANGGSFRPAGLTPALNPLPELKMEADSYPIVWVAIFVIWLAGVLVLALGQVLEWRRLRNLVRASTLVRMTWLQDELKQFCRLLGLSRRPRLLEGGGLSSPVLVGVIRPDIVIPEGWLENLEAGPARMMVAHELVHLKRRDLVWNWLPAVARTLFFFHPLVWIFLKEWRLAQEMACDEQAVLTGRVSPADYGAMLVSVVARGGSIPTPRISHFSAGILESKETLKRRLIAMKVMRSLSYPRLVLWTGATMLIASLLLVPWRLTAQDSSPEGIEPVGANVSVKKSKSSAPDGGPAISQPAKEPGPDSARGLNAISKDRFSEQDVIIKEKRIFGGLTDDSADGAASHAWGGADQTHGQVHQYPAKSSAKQNVDVEAIHALKAELQAVEVEVELAGHRLKHSRELMEQKVVSEEEMMKARAEFARARANLAQAQARLNDEENRYSHQSKFNQTRDQDRIIQALTRQVEDLKSQLHQQVRHNAITDLNRLRQSDGKNSPFAYPLEDSSDALSAPGIIHGDTASLPQRTLERELIEQEIELAERQLSIQQERFKAGQLTEDQVLALQREILSLKRQKIRLGNGEGPTSVQSNF